jgi:hypothetical protein
MIVDRKRARVVYSDWSDPDLLDFIDRSYHDFAKSLFGGDFRMQYDDGWWPDGSVKSYITPVNEENAATIRELMVGKEVQVEDENGGVTQTVVTPEMVAGLKGDDLLSQAEEWGMEEIVDATKRAIADAATDAQEAGYLKYYQEGVLLAMGGANPTFIEVEKGKNWQLQIEIGLANLQTACEGILDEHGEDWNNMKSILVEAAEKWEPNDRFEPSGRSDASYFNDQLQFHLGEL